jgi:hypothetical protein
MAKIHEEVIVIKLSKLVRESDPAVTVATDDIVAALSTVAEELAGAGVVVEVDLLLMENPNKVITARCLSTSHSVNRVSQSVN